MTAFRFVSSSGPDNPEGEVRFLASASTIYDALDLKKALESSIPAGTTAVIFRSLFDRANTGGPDQPPRCLWRLREDDPKFLPLNVSSTGKEQIGFDIFSAPSILVETDWNGLCRKVQELVDKFSLERDPVPAN